MEYSQVIKDKFPDLSEFNSKNKDFILSAITIPAIKADFIEDDNDYSFAKQLLISECKRFKSVESNIAVPDVESNAASVSNALISFCSRRLQRSNSVENEIESEVNRYLENNDKNYNMLNAYPLVREVFYLYNTTLSSSAAVERLFSQSLLVYAKNRNRISPENFERTLLLKYNQQLIN